MAIEFTAQPILPIMEVSFFLFGCIVYINYSRASSPTRTVFRLNTNQSYAYEDYLLKYLNLNYIR